MVSEGIEITQLPMDADLSTHIHHHITIYNTVIRGAGLFLILIYQSVSYFPNKFFLCNINILLLFCVHILIGCQTSESLSILCIAPDLQEIVTCVQNKDASISSYAICYTYY